MDFVLCCSNLFAPVFCFSLFHVTPPWPSQTEELVKALQDLENAASGDAAVRQKIASLPQEVQDVSLLEKITGKIWVFNMDDRNTIYELQSWLLAKSLQKNYKMQLEM